MNKARWLSFGRVIDAATLVLCLSAIWLVLQPGSLVRSRIDSAIADWRTKQAATEKWGELSEAAIALGGPDTRTMLAVFTDYDCDFCRAFEPTVDSLLSDGTGLAAVLVPRSTDPFAVAAAEAVLCAHEQAAAQRMHRTLMRSEDWRTSGDFVAVARESDLRDIGAFRSCIASGRPKERLAQMRALSDYLGITGTPTLVSPRAVLRGIVSVEQIHAMGLTSGS